MTLSDLDAKSADLEALRAGWASAILRIVYSRLEDVLAHARTAGTGPESLRRPGSVAARPERSRGYAQAAARLAGLLDWLAGPEPGSLDGRIQDAREAFYRRARDLHRPLIPAELRAAGGPEPAPLLVDLVRGAPLHGYDPRAELAPIFDTALRGLTAAVAGPRRRTGREDARADPIATWHAGTREAIERSVLTLLSDSVEYADGEAGRDLIDPEFREEAVS